MTRPSLLRRLLDRLVRWFKPRRPPARAPSQPQTPARPAESDGEERPYPPTRYTIQVEEVDQVSFIQEWGRSVARVSHQETVTESVDAPGYDRRLPDHERRQPRTDRRSGDRRGQT